MKTINAQARANSGLAIILDDRRDNGVNTAAVKRQSRRQVRHHLKAGLRLELDQHFAEAKELITYQRSVDSPKPSTHTSTNIISFPCPEIRNGRVVQVVRKLAGDPFLRKQMQVTMLAA